MFLLYLSTICVTLLKYECVESNLVHVELKEKRCLIQLLS